MVATKRKSFKWQRLVALTKMILQMATNDGNNKENYANGRDWWHYNKDDFANGNE